MDLVKNIAPASVIQQVRLSLGAMSGRMKLISLNDSLRKSLGVVPPPEQLSLSMSCERFVSKWQALGAEAGTPYSLWQEVVAKDVALCQAQRGISQIAGSVRDGALLLASVTTEMNDQIEVYVESQEANSSVSGSSRDQLDFASALAFSLRDRIAQGTAARSERSGRRAARIAGQVGVNQAAAQRLLDAERLTSAALPAQAADAVAAGTKKAVRALPAKKGHGKKGGKA